jgi:hypothetical protein
MSSLKRLYRKTTDLRGARAWYRTALVLRVWAKLTDGSVHLDVHGRFGPPIAIRCCEAYRSHGMNKAAFAAIILAAGVPGLSRAIELQPSTLQAWDNYVSTADSRMRERAHGSRPFLWADESADRRASLRRGEILVVPVSGRGIHSAPNGLIHDWMGAVFIPNASVEAFLAVAHDYDRYKEIYKPVVADSKVLSNAGLDHSYSMIWQRRVLFVNAALEGQYQAHDFAIDERRGYSITATTRMQEFEGYGHSNARLLPPDQGDGFIWRMHSIVRYEERDAGLYLEIEAMALTRDIPASLRWVVKPVVNHLSMDSLMTSLRETRDAVNAADKPRGLVSGTVAGHNSGKH